MNQTSSESHNSEISTGTFGTRVNKYKGLLKRASMKNFRDNWLRYFDYLHTMGSTSVLLISFFRALYIVQIIGLSLLPFNVTVWSLNTLIGRLMSVFCIYYIFLPGYSDHDAIFTAIIACYVVFLCCIVLVTVTYFVFIRISKINSVFVAIIEFIFDIFNPYIVQMVGAMFAFSIHTCFEGPTVTSYVVLALSVFFLFDIFILHTIFVSPSLSFRPQIFQIFTMRRTWQFMLANLCYTVFATLGAMMNYAPYTYIFGALAFVSLLALGWCTLLPDAFVLDEHKSRFLAAYGASAILMIVQYGLIIAGKTASEVVVICSFVIYKVVRFCFELVEPRVLEVRNELLDSLNAGEMTVEELPRSTLLALMHYGFEIGHPYCHSWKLFNMTAQKYPKDEIVWLFYAKYAAIYAEENKTLLLVGNTLQSMKKNNLEIKVILFQIHSLMQQRETFLSKSLKRSITKIEDKVEKCRGQMRFIWESVIRGNMTEIESLASQLRANIDEVRRDFFYLVLVYPNNAFVASAYASFLTEILKDQREAAEWTYIYKQLRNGMRLRQERAYSYALKIMPDLLTEDRHTEIGREMSADYIPHTALEHSAAASTLSHGVVSMDQMDVVDERATVKYIESMINIVKLPSAKYGPYVLIGVFIILIPSLVLSFGYVLRQKLEESHSAATFLSKFAQMKCYVTHLGLYSFNYALSSITAAKTAVQLWASMNPGGATAPTFIAGLSSDTAAIHQIASDLQANINDLNLALPDFAGNSLFAAPLSSYYGRKTHFKQYFDSQTFSNEMVSLQHQATYFLALATKLADIPPAGINAYLQDSDVWTLFYGLGDFIETADTVMAQLTTSVENMVKEKEQVSQIFMYCMLLGGLLVAAISFGIILWKLQQEKKQIYTCFQMLPKSAVSQIVQTLNSQSSKNRSSENDSLNRKELNAQEENALRLLSTSIDRGFGVMGKLLTIVIVMAFFSIYMVFEAAYTHTLFVGFDGDTVNTVPLFNLATTIHCLMGDITLQLLHIASESDGTYESTYSPSTFHTARHDSIHNHVSSILEHLHTLKFGDSSKGAYGAYYGGNDFTSLLATVSCTWDGEVTTVFGDIFKCVNYEVGLSYIYRMTTYLFELNDIASIALTDYHFPYYSYWLSKLSYNDFVSPSIDALKEELGTKQQSAESSITILMYLTVVVCILVLILLAVPFSQIAGTAKWALRLLLYCDPAVVLQSKPITKILSNDFSVSKDQSSTDKTNFYETVVGHSLDAVVFMLNDCVIRSVNDSVESIFGVKADEILGKHLEELLIAPDDGDQSCAQFFSILDGALHALRPPQIEMEVVVKRGDEESVTLQITLTAVSSSGQVQTQPTNIEGIALFALVAKDMTAAIASRTLLQEERAKSDRLLSLILPPVIAKKLQAGEQNISFPVQTASVLFADIVGFTPWCASLSAAQVMSSLNRLFMVFDQALSKYPSLSKIKCIGDCYMAAGGIFDEVNQPANHAKQMINFGLDIIDSLAVINEELNSNLRVRVGVNTGGPIVAGVLGIEKPTFDILGPTISMAQQMEHHGVPMCVHIPISVYELVYSENFKFKERGEIEVKTGSIKTYLVTGVRSNE